MRFLLELFGFLLSPILPGLDSVRQFFFLFLRGFAFPGGKSFSESIWP